MTRKTASLSSAFAAIIASAVLAGCAKQVAPPSHEPACIRWERIKLDEWQEGQIYGVDYPKTINPDFSKWRTLIEQLARNNTNRREHCEHFWTPTFDQLRALFPEELRTIGL